MMHCTCDDDGDLCGACEDVLRGEADPSISILNARWMAQCRERGIPTLYDVDHALPKAA